MSFEVDVIANATTQMWVDYISDSELGVRNIFNSKMAFPQNILSLNRHSCFVGKRLNEVFYIVYCNHVVRQFEKDKTTTTNKCVIDLKQVRLLYDNFVMYDNFVIHSNKNIFVKCFE